MRKIENWDELKATTDEVISFESLPVGPQYCKIVDVQDWDEKEYLKIYFDVVKGDFKDVFKDQEERFGNWPSQGIMYWSYKKTAERFFAAHITAIEKSNDGFKWDWLPQNLKGKYFVANFAEEEYVDDNEVKVSLKVREVRSIQAMKDGNVKELPIKLLPEDKKPQQTIIDEISDDLPF